MFCVLREKNQIEKNEISVVFAGVEAIDCSVEAKNNEARIKRAIFCNYDKNARPSLTDGPIKLKFKMIVKGFNFETSSNKLTVSSWLAMVMNCEHKYKINSGHAQCALHSSTNRV